MAKILLTGCAGFIGSHTAERLLSEGYEVIGIDNFSKFYDRKIKEKNLDNFRNHPDFEFIELDIRDKDAMDKLLPENVDLVLHLAAKAGVRPSILAPEAYINVNIKGTHHLLEWMFENDCKKMFFASSSSIYGNQKVVPFEEDHVDDSPISPYAATKRSAELINYTYHHLYKLDIINARFFTVFGPRQRPDLAIHKFTKLIDKGHSIDMYGDGSTARDYTYISDTVDGIMRGVKHLLENDGVFETINLGNNKPIELKDMIETIYRKMGAAPKINELPMQEGDVNITYASIEKAKDLLGYEPKVSFEEGVEKFIEWYRSN